MKRITEKEAIKLLNHGQFVKCKVSRDYFEPVKSIQALENLKILSKRGVQGFELFLVPKISLRKKVDALSIEESVYELNSKKSVVYAFVNGKERIITSFAELIKVCRACEIWGDEIILYKRKARK